MRIDAATDNAFTSLVFSDVDSGGSAGPYAVTGLDPTKTYYFRARAHASFGVSANSGVLAILPPAPTNVLANVVSTTEIDLSWNGHSVSESYVINRSTDGTTYSLLTVVQQAVTTYADTGLTPGTTYYYQIAAVRDTGRGPFASITVAAQPNPPGIPTGVTATATSATTVSINASGDGTQTGFAVERSTDNATWGSPIATPASMPYVNSGLSASTTYYYRVAASNTWGTSAYSSSISATTPVAPPAPPAVPTGLSATSPVQTMVKLSWTAGDNTASSYQVQRSPDGSSWSNLGTSLTTSYIDTTTVAATTYYYRVAGVNSQGTGTYTAGLQVATADPALSVEEIAILNFVPSAAATFVSTGTGGFWDATTTWQGGAVPTAGANVLITAGSTVTIRTVLSNSVNWIRVEGTLAFSPTANTGLTVDTIVVPMGGALQMGTVANPITATCTVTFSGGAIDTTKDPRQLSRGIVYMGGMNGMMGSWTAVGAFRTPWVACNPVTSGSNTITLASTPTNWQVGDTIVIPAVNATPPGLTDDVLTIQSISGNTVTTTTTTLYNHVPPTGQNAHCVNITPRNIVIQSAAPGTITATGPNASSVSQRGHIMMMDSNVYWDGVYITNCGRTSKAERVNDPLFDTNYNLIANTGLNPRGRYSQHFHKCGTDKTSVTKGIIKNCVITNDPGWGFVLHSSWADYTSNISYRIFGTGFMTEVGDEIGTYSSNFALRSLSQLSNTLNEDSRLHAGTNPGETGGDFAFLGYGFWFHGFGCVATNNIAAGHNGTNSSEGIIMYNQPMFKLDNFNNLTTVEPQFLSANLADPSIAGAATSIPIELVPLQGYSGNISYSCQIGMGLAHNNATQGQNGNPCNLWGPNTSYMCSDGFRLRYTFFSTLQGLVATNCTQQGINAPNEGAHSTTFTNCTCTSCKYGVSTNFFSTSIGEFIHNCTLDGFTANVWAVRAQEKQVATFTVDSTTFGTSGPNDWLLSWSDASTQAVMSASSPPGPSYGIDQLFTPYLLLYTPISGSQQQVYFSQQDPSAVLFPSSMSSVWNQYKVPSVLVGMTNQQMWDTYGIAFNGSLIPGGTTTTRISGGSIGPVANNPFPLSQINVRTLVPGSNTNYNLIIQDNTTSPATVIINETGITLQSGWNMFTRTLTYQGHTATRTYFVWGN